MSKQRETTTRRKHGITNKEHNTDTIITGVVGRLQTAGLVDRELPFARLDHLVILNEGGQVPVSVEF